MSEDDICLHLESTQVQRRKLKSEELCSPWYTLVIQKGEMRNPLNQIFYEEVIRPLLSSQISRIAKLALWCLQELSS